MICAQVVGNNVAIQIANSMGHFQLNVFMPLIIRNLVNSVRLLNDGFESFAKNCVDGIKLNTKNIDKYVNSSPMLITGLNSKLGYDKCNQIVKHSQKNNLTLKEAAVELKMVSGEEFDKYINAKLMAKPF